MKATLGHWPLSWGRWVAVRAVSRGGAIKVLWGKRTLGMRSRFC